MTGVIEDWVEAADGTPIAYRDHGGVGRGLVLLHGGGANLESMDQYAARLGSGRRAVAIDIRACGQSGDPVRFRLTDAATDVAEVVDALGLGPVDVVGHSMGGFVAGFYGSAHPTARIVSIDGFGPGMVTVGSEAERAEFRAFQAGMRAAFFAMTEAPESGDQAWRDQQVEALCDVFPRIGYAAPNARAMAAQLRRRGRPLPPSSATTSVRRCIRRRRRGGHPADVPRRQVPDADHSMHRVGCTTGARRRTCGAGDSQQVGDRAAPPLDTPRAGMGRAGGSRQPHRAVPGHRELNERLSFNR
jgi:pimeloyl-ACP methyl ester carboxylesterase